MYEWLQAFKQGINMPMIYVIYAPGSKIGNLYWVWHCTAMSIDEALKMSHTRGIFSFLQHALHRT